ncbi:hypothetical protein DSUL_20194 [Desulfovibrionales bacterium]
MQILTDKIKYHVIINWRLKKLHVLSRHVPDTAVADFSIICG